MEQTAIKVMNATVKYNMASGKIDNLKEYFIKFVKGQIHYTEFSALKNVEFEVKKGESWGIIGANGAGKSTLLKLICNIITPSSGSVYTNGSISPLIELGAGFDGSLTTRENIFLQGALLGYSKKTMKEYFDEIIEFSELQEFIDVPVKTFSSGMHARLGFSIASIIKPDILIVDEVLAVGDAAFRQKSMAKINEIIEKSSTLLYVSHSLDTVKKLCKNAIWLQKGEIVMSGLSGEVCDAYLQSVKK